jgi:hypothetical protein
LSLNGSFPSGWRSERFFLYIIVFTVSSEDEAKCHLHGMLKST